MLLKCSTTKIFIFRQGGSFATGWTEGRFIKNHPEGINLRILITEKENKECIRKQEDNR